MNVLICDDCRSDAEILYKYVCKYSHKKGTLFNIDVETSPANIIDTDKKFDIAFLDIQMDRVNGIELAKALVDCNKNILLFFVSGYNIYMDDAMDIRPFRFFDKPVDEVRLFKGIDRAVEHIAGTSVNIYTQYKGVQTKLRSDDIILVSINRRKTRIETTAGTLQDDRNIDFWNEQLPEAYFKRIHKSYIINLRYIKECSYKTVLMINDEIIAIPSRRQAEFHKEWFAYINK